MDLRRLEARQSAVRTVERVVKAVWALARAQLVLAERAAAEALSHVAELDELLARLAGAPRAPADPGAVLHVVFGPEHALTGGLAERMRHAIPETGRLGIVGTRLWEILEARDLHRARVAFHLPAATSVAGLDAQARALAEAIIAALEAFADGGEVRLVHPVSEREAVATAVLLSGPREAVAHPPETLSPLPAVIAEVAAQALEARIAAALAESLRSELKSRVVAAGQAREVAGDKLAEIEQLTRIVRQGDVTREVVELAAATLARDASSR